MNNTGSFNRLVDIMNELREKCPWDKKQTIQSLRTLTIEEMYELADAVTKENWNDIKEELGDVLMHVVFYAKIASEKDQFTLDDVIETVCAKLITRHPHIYGNVQVKDEEDVKKNWEQIKLSEGKTSVLQGVPAALPAVIKATRIQEKARQVGFEWSNKEDVWSKVDEETNELKAAIKNNDPHNIEEEFGDLMFSLINYARFLNIDAETALEKTNKKFISRFTAMERVAATTGKQLHVLTLAEMNAIWNVVKKETPPLD